MGHGARGLQPERHSLTRRLTRLFLRGPDARRPVFGTSERLQSDPHFRDHLLFYEYFHGDSGCGLGASHQTGWTGLIAKLLMPRRPPSSVPEAEHPALLLGRGCLAGHWAQDASCTEACDERE